MRALSCFKRHVVSAFVRISAGCWYFGTCEIAKDFWLISSLQVYVFRSLRYASGVFN